MPQLKRKLLVVSILLFVCLRANAIIITGYDVLNASRSGTGAWSHTYTGTITPLGSGFANYTGGTGTMADGLITGAISNNQLFCEVNSGCSSKSLTQPTITLYFDGVYTVSSLSIFGANGFSSNSIPGAITGFDLTIGALTQTILTTQFGAPGASGQLVNDLATLTGTGLDNILTNQVIISNITYLEQGTTLLGRFNISEIQAAGLSAQVPEPATIALLGMGFIGLRCLRRKKV